MPDLNIFQFENPCSKPGSAFLHHFRKPGIHQIIPWRWLKRIGDKMNKLFLILAISVMITACGHDLKPPTQDTTPGPAYLSDSDQA